ncbi:nucleotide exchange factor GrpE, partial [Thermoproteota archaeon]
SIRIVKGLDMILINLNKILKQEGVVRIDALGQPFDPLKHEVTSFIETAKMKENIIVKELKKGYLLNNKVIRASSVVVSRNSFD